MEMSVREARAQFAAALSAAARGERVTITKHGKAVAELGPPTPAPRKKWDWDSLDRLQEELGIPQLTPEQSARQEAWFNDPDWGYKVLGLDKWEAGTP